MTLQRDRLFAQHRADIEAFAFDERVAAVFGDMIRRSVPGYATVVAMTAVLAGQYARAGTLCYDLGCSLGATTLAMRHQLDADRRILAVDNAPAMLDRLRSLLIEISLQEDTSGTPTANGQADVELVQADIRDMPISNASVVVLNFTLQFVPKEERDALLQRIHDGLVPGGVLILSEKIASDDAAQGAWLDDLHHAFKRANGYSDLEISQKRTALERVLLPEALSHHEARLARVGFPRILRWMQCLNFVSLLAVK